MMNTAFPGVMPPATFNRPLPPLMPTVPGLPQLPGSFMPPAMPQLQDPSIPSLPAPPTAESFTSSTTTPAPAESYWNGKTIAYSLLALGLTGLTGGFIGSKIGKSALEKELEEAKTALQNATAKGEEKGAEEAEKAAESATEPVAPVVENSTPPAEVKPAANSTAWTAAKYGAGTLALGAAAHYGLQSTMGIGLHEVIPQAASKSWEYAGRPAMEYGKSWIPAGSTVAGAYHAFKNGVVGSPDYITGAIGSAVSKLGSFWSGTKSVTPEVLKDMCPNPHVFGETTRYANSTIPLTNLADNVFRH